MLQIRVPASQIENAVAWFNYTGYTVTSTKTVQDGYIFKIRERMSFEYPVHSTRPLIKATRCSHPRSRFLISKIRTELP